MRTTGRGGGRRSALRLPGNPRSGGPAGPVDAGPWGKGFGDEFGDKIPRARGSRMGRGQGIGVLTGDARGAGRGKRKFGQGELRLVLLEMIGRQTRHGYGLIRVLEELTGGHYAPSPGAVYPTLALLAEEGLIAEPEDHAGSAKKVFTLTPAGKTLLAAEAEKVTQILARLRAMEEGEIQDVPPIRRAIDKLLIATRNRAEADGFTDEVAHRIAAILDDAAGQIERL